MDYYEIGYSIGNEIMKKFPSGTTDYGSMRDAIADGVVLALTRSQKSEAQSQATNKVHDAIALLDEVKEMLSRNFCADERTDVMERIDAVLAQQHHA